MCSREEVKRLIEVESGACGSTKKRNKKGSENVDDRLDDKQPHTIV
jgi:hypothetical protein